MSNDCVRRNYEIKEAMLNVPYSKYRVSVLRKFIGKSKPSIDLGCGGFMPEILGVTHACDDSLLAYNYLKKSGWKGKFKLADIGKSIPYKDKMFKVAVCSEVIEHLKTKEEVTNAIKEIDRISDKWLITTPSVYFSDKDHKFFFTPNDLFKIMPWGIEGNMQKYIIFQKLNYYYITNDIDRVGKIMEIKWKKI